MPDKYTPEKRSSIMSQVKGSDTGPEKFIRRLLHKMGYRFRLRRKDLPGKPDIVLPKYRSVIFVHGCFWHGHSGCPRAKRPETRAVFWNHKLDRNIERDIRVQKELAAFGWKVLIIWQCEIKNVEELSVKLRSFLETDS